MSSGGDAVLGLGVDGGGSATRWALHGSAGAVAAGELGPVSGHLFLAAERDRFAALCASLRAVLAGHGAVGAVVAGITGLSATSPDAAVAASGLADAAGVAAARVHVEDDIWIAYHAAFAPGEGHVVYAGTGSIGVHVRADGSVVRVGGRGMLIDDAGSAFAIGRAALDAVWRARDEASSPGGGALEEALSAAIGGADWDRVRAYVYGGGRDAVAQLARAVAAAAEAGDRTALQVLATAGAELARLARALAQREGLRPVALLGRAAGLHPVMLATMRRAAPLLQIERLALDAAATAARLAYERARSDRG